MFVVIETAPWIHPGYRGCLTLEIANVSNTPLLLYPGRPVAQLILFDTPGAKPRDQQSGTYMGPVYPEAPKFKEPSYELEMLGIPNPEEPQPPKPIRNRCPECLTKLLPGLTRCTFCNEKV
jgi:hypothetical protein